MFIFGIALTDQRSTLNLRAGKSLENGSRTMEDNFLSTCCDATPLDNIEYDSCDGSYGEALPVVYATCSDCNKWARLY